MEASLDEPDSLSEEDKIDAEEKAALAKYQAELLNRPPLDIRSLFLGLASPERIRNWSHGEVTKPETINYRTFRPERNGLFCERIFGPVTDWECACGKYRRVRYRGIVCERCGVEVTHSKVRRERMGHIELASPITHIWFLNAVPFYLSLLLDLTLKELSEVIYYESYIVTEVLPEIEAVFGEKTLLSEQKYLEMKEKYGDKFSADIGARAIKVLLQKVDLQELRSQTQRELIYSKTDKKKKLLHRLAMVQGFLSSGAKPEWLVLDVLPVLPPDLRPMVHLEGGRFATSDLNDLYRRVINHNNRLRRLLEIGAPNMIVKNEMRMLQEAVDVLFNNGVRGRVVTGSNGRALKSISDVIKSRLTQSSANNVDYSASTTCVQDDAFPPHQCGIPRKIALEIFKPFVIRRLIEKEYVQNTKAAKRMIERSEEIIDDILDEVVSEHQVIVSPKNTLNIGRMYGLWPRLCNDNAVHVHPLIYSMFEMNESEYSVKIHLPLSTEAQTETSILLSPSEHFFTLFDGSLIIPPLLSTKLSWITRENVKNGHEIVALCEELPLLKNRYGYSQNVIIPWGNKVFHTTIGRALINLIFLSYFKKSGYSYDYFDDEFNYEKITLIASDYYAYCGSEYLLDLLVSIYDFSKEIVTETDGMTINNHSPSSFEYFNSCLDSRRSLLYRNMFRGAKSQYADWNVQYDATPDEDNDYYAIPAKIFLLYKTLQTALGDISITEIDCCSPLPDQCEIDDLRSGIDVARSILNCHAKKGVCLKCYGETMNGVQDVSVGEAVGTLTAQAFGEAIVDLYRNAHDVESLKLVFSVMGKFTSFLKEGRIQLETKKDLDIISFSHISNLNSYRLLMLEHLERIFSDANLNVRLNHLLMIVYLLSKWARVEDHNNPDYHHGQIVPLLNLKSTKVRYSYVILGINETSLYGKSMFNKIKQTGRAKAVLTQEGLWGRVQKTNDVITSIIAGKLVPSGTGFVERKYNVELSKWRHL